MASYLSKLKVNEVSLVGKGANGRRVYLRKSADSLDEVDVTVAEPTVELEKALAAAAESAVALEKAAVEKATLEARLVELEKAQTDALAKAAAEKVEVEKALAAQVEAAAVAECIQKASVDFKNLPEPAADLGPLLRNVSKVDPVAGVKLEALLKKLDALAKSALEPKGTTVAADATASAWDEIQKRASKVVAEKGAPTLAQAVEAVMKADPSLYDKHQAERAAR
jgi:hypothetical protein